MPELAEVEYFRKRWDDGLRERVRSVALHGEKRIFRGTDCARLKEVLTGATYLGSETRGKQIALRFTRNAWLGIHLGLTGDLRVEAADFEPERHDHLVLRQAKRALVLKDARQFGRVRFHVGKEPPDWWSEGPPAVSSKEFTSKWVGDGLRRRRVAIKTALLAQSLFAGVGNWMADEILWRARLNPHTLSADLTRQEVKSLWRSTREVCRVALATIGVDWGDPPKGWLIHTRWKRDGKCPRDGLKLRREQIGGRTTAWCPVCQKC